jgi:hypothetical protein
MSAELAENNGEVGTRAGDGGRSGRFEVGGLETSTPVEEEEDGDPFARFMRTDGASRGST